MCVCLCVFPQQQFVNTCLARAERFTGGKKGDVEMLRGGDWCEEREAAVSPTVLV